MIWNEEELKIIEQVENVPRETLYEWLLNEARRRPLPKSSAARIFLGICEVENDYKDVVIKIKHNQGIFKARLIIQGIIAEQTYDYELRFYPHQITRESKIKGDLPEYFIRNSDNLATRKLLRTIIEKIPVVEVDL